MKQLENAGYQQYPPPTGSYADCLWQKRIIDDRGTRYFLNFYQYADRFQSEVYFRSSESVIRVSYWELPGLEQVEEFFNRLWAAMSFDYAEKRS